MNNSGVVIGGACGASDEYGYWSDCVGWIWDGQQYRTVVVPTYYIGTMMAGINDQGEIVIQSDSVPTIMPFNPLRAYWLDRGDPTLIVLPETPATLGSEYAGVYDLNNKGEMVMMAPLDDPAGYYVPLIFDRRHNTVTRLPDIPFDTCQSGGAFYTGMNDEGAVVGVCWEITEAFNVVQHAFVGHKADARRP